MDMFNMIFLLYMIQQSIISLLVVYDIKLLSTPVALVTCSGIRRNACQYGVYAYQHGC